MKKIMLAVGCLFVAVNSFARNEVNPDKSFSIGYLFGITSLSGSYAAKTLDTNWTAFDFPVDWKMQTHVVDIRLPLSDHFTIFSGVGLSKLDITDRDSTVTVIGADLFDFNIPTKRSMSGYNLHLGGRYYF